MKTINFVAMAGIRPQFIKLASLDNTLNSWNNSQSKFCPIYVNLNQHYDVTLAGKYIAEGNLEFHHIIGHVDKQPMAIFASIITNLERILLSLEVKPQFAIIFGDANCSLAAGIAAAKLDINVVHIESGVRTGGLQENLNGRLVDHLSFINFAATPNCVANLAKEGIKHNVFEVGDLYFDVIKKMEEALIPGLPGAPFVRDYVLVTLHHNIDKNLLITILEILHKQRRDTVLVYHPRHIDIIEKLASKPNKKLRLIPPLSHREMLSAVQSSAFVITDSGGIQREAYFLKKHCLLVQEEAFWPELADDKVHRLVGANASDLSLGLDWVENTLSEDYPQIRGFGVGNTGQRILERLSEIF